MSVLLGMAPWALTILSLAVCAATAVGFRLLLRRTLADDPSRAAAVAGPLMPALGAVFALLAATSLATEAGQFRSSEENVSAESAAASRLAWAATTPGIDRAPIQRQLATYLASTRRNEWVGRNREGDPRTMVALGRLERTVRTEAAGKDVGSAQAGELLGALDSLTSLRRQRLAAGANELPDLYLIVVLMSGLALVANSAALALGHPGRFAALTTGLVVVVALALALLIAISSPFEGGFVANGGPLDAIRDALHAGSFGS